MLIQVVYSDNRYDYVKDFQLDNEIALGRVIKFRRGSGWVTVGVDPIRSSKSKGPPNGIERRGERPNSAWKM